MRNFIKFFLICTLFLFSSAQDSKAGWFLSKEDGDPPRQRTRTHVNGQNNYWFPSHFNWNPFNILAASFNYFQSWCSKPPLTNTEDPELPPLSQDFQTVATQGTSSPPQPQQASSPRNTSSQSPEILNPTGPASSAPIPQDPLGTTDDKIGTGIPPINPTDPVHVTPIPQNSPTLIINTTDDPIRKEHLPPLLPASPTYASPCKPAPSKPPAPSANISPNLTPESQELSINKQKNKEQKNKVPKFKINRSVESRSVESESDSETMPCESKEKSINALNQNSESTSGSTSDEQ